MTRHLPALLLLALAACSKSNSNGGTGPGPTGSLDITISAPAGVSAKVNVITPADSIITVSSSGTLHGLTPGDYVIRASAGVTADPIVSTAYAPAVTGSPATVAAGQTANATVTYSAPRASSGILWVANAIANNISGFSSANLGATGAPVPAVKIGSGTSGSVVQGSVSIAVDSSGGIWYVNNSDTLKYYSASQITANTNAAPARKLVSTAIQYAIAVAFDASGDLWVADQANAKLFEFTPSQLQAGGTQSPAVTIHSIIGSLKRPWSLAFDAKGDLWVDSYGDSTIVGFSPAQLATSGGPVPYAAISGSQGTTDCLGIAFDAQGDLWVATLSDTIAKFTPDALTAIGTPTPSVILKMPGGTSPIAIAFDNSGSLWVAAYVGDKLLKFTSSQLTATGSPTPTTIISNTGGSLQVPQGLAFSPPAQGLPIP